MAAVPAQHQCLSFILLRFVSFVLRRSTALKAGAEGEHVYHHAELMLAVLLSRNGKGCARACGGQCRVDNEDTIARGTTSCRMTWADMYTHTHTYLIPTHIQTQTFWAEWISFRCPSLCTKPPSRNGSSILRSFRFLILSLYGLFRRPFPLFF